MKKLEQQMKGNAAHAAHTGEYKEWFSSNFVPEFRKKLYHVFRAELMTGDEWCMYALANFESLVLAYVKADFCN